MITMVRLGNASVECVTCKGKIFVNPTMKYLYECVKRLQIDEKFILRASESKLDTAEAILGMMYPLGIREIERKKIKDGNSDFIDITVKRQ
jgi:hypothetical protein